MPTDTVDHVPNQYRAEAHSLPQPLLVANMRACATCAARVCVALCADLRSRVRVIFCPEWEVATDALARRAPPHLAYCPALSNCSEQMSNRWNSGRVQTCSCAVLTLMLAHRAARAVCTNVRDVRCHARCLCCAQTAVTVCACLSATQREAAPCCLASHPASCNKKGFFSTSLTHPISEIASVCVCVCYCSFLFNVSRKSTESSFPWPTWDHCCNSSPLVLQHLATQFILTFLQPLH